MRSAACSALIVAVVTVVVLLSGVAGGAFPWADRCDRLSCSIFDGLGALAGADARHLLRRARQLRPAVDPDVHPDGRRPSPPLAGRRRPLRGPGPLADPGAGRAHVASNIGACATLRRASPAPRPATCAAIGKMGVPEMRRRGYPDGLASRLHRRRRHAGHPDPAVDHHDRLRHRHRDLDRPAVPRRPRCLGLHADRCCSSPGRSDSTLRAQGPYLRSLATVSFSWRERFEVLPKRRALPRWSFGGILWVHLRRRRDPFRGGRGGGGASASCMVDGDLQAAQAAASSGCVMRDSMQGVGDDPR